MTRHLGALTTFALLTLTATPALAADEQLMPYGFLIGIAMVVYFGIMFSIWFVAKRWKKIEAAQDRKRAERMAGLTPGPSPQDAERGDSEPSP